MSQEAIRKRKDLLEKVRAMLRMTVENGCTEAEAAAAAEAAMRLMDRYHLSAQDLEEKEEAPFVKAKSHVPDDIGSRLWRPAIWIAKLTTTRTWTVTGQVGMDVFFGRDCDVEIATYLLAICEGAMRRAHRDYYATLVLFRPNVRRRQSLAFLDGMVKRLCETLEAILAARQAEGSGTDLVVSRQAEVDDELKRRKVALRTNRPRAMYSEDDGFDEGVAAASGVTFNDAVRRETVDEPFRITHEDALA